VWLKKINPAKLVDWEVVILALVSPEVLKVTVPIGLEDVPVTDPVTLNTMLSSNTIAVLDPAVTPPSIVLVPETPALLITTWHPEFGRF